MKGGEGRKRLREQEDARRVDKNGGIKPEDTRV